MGHPILPGTTKHWVSGTEHENKANLRSQPNEVILLIYLFKLQVVNYCCVASLVSLLNKHGKVLGGRGHQCISPQRGSTSPCSLPVLQTGLDVLTSPRSTPSRLQGKPNQDGRGLKKKNHEQTDNSVWILKHFFAKRCDFTSGLRNDAHLGQKSVSHYTPAQPHLIHWERWMTECCWVFQV